jgi:aminopeptidase N
VGGGIGGWLSSKQSTQSGDDPCAWGSYRLPQSAVPTHYDVYWDLSNAFAPPFSFSGQAAIQVTALSAAKCVLVHSRSLAISSAAVDADGAAPALVVSYSPDPFPQSDRLIIRLPTTAVGARSLLLRFNFTGNLSDTVIGFYGSTYSNATSVMPIVQTKFEPSFARTAFPCFDEPAMKATFSLTVKGVPPGYQALGNMPVLSLTAGSVTFQTSPVMSTCES